MTNEYTRDGTAQKAKEAKLPGRRDNARPTRHKAHHILITSSHGVLTPPTILQLQSQPGSGVNIIILQR